MTLTQYVVLRREDDETYREVWRGDAHSARYAVKRAATDDGMTEGTFVAVPIRSFEAIALSVETVQKVHVS